MPIDVEVMIVSYGSVDEVADCLRSIALLVPDAAVALREHHPDRDRYRRLEEVATASPLTVRLEHDPTNPGFGAGCNALAASSLATWHLFLNPDAQVLAWPWVDDAPAAPRIIGPDFTADGTDHAGRSYRIRDEIARSWLRRPGPPPDGIGFVSGAALMVDRDTFRRLDGFDEGYFLFYEDIDLCLRANALGVPTVIDRRWRVAHARSHSTRERFDRALMWSYDSGCRFHETHGSPRRGYQLYVAVDAVARAVLHGVRGRRTERDAYAALARRAISDCVRRGRSRP